MNRADHQGNPALGGQELNRFTAPRVQQRFGQSTVTVNTSTCRVPDATHYFYTSKSPICKVFKIHSITNVNADFSVWWGRYIEFSLRLRICRDWPFGCSNYFRDFRGSVGAFAFN